MTYRHDDDFRPLVLILEAVASSVWRRGLDCCLVAQDQPETVFLHRSIVVAVLCGGHGHSEQVAAQLGEQNQGGEEGAGGDHGAWDSSGQLLS